MPVTRRDAGRDAAGADHDLTAAVAVDGAVDAAEAALYVIEAHLLDPETDPRLVRQDPQAAGRKRPPSRLLSPFAGPVPCGHRAFLRSGALVTATAPWREGVAPAAHALKQATRTSPRGSRR